MSVFLRWIERLFGRRGSASPQTLASLTSRIDLAQLERALQHRIHRPEVFAQALVHRSSLHSYNLPPFQSNERLEFLGDSVLNLVVGEYLYGLKPRAEEGELTILRSRLVNRKALVSYARQVDLRRHIRANAGATQIADKGMDSILADCFEAIIGAIYVDGGLEPARAFVLRQMRRALDDGTLSTADENFKSALLELSQAAGKGVPKYAVVHEEGPDHDRTFTVEVTLENITVGIGRGKNKKEAEQAAAGQAIRSLQPDEQ